MLRDLPRNARNCIMVEPLWAVFGGMIFFYVPLYMKEIGLSEVEMGIINTIALFMAFVCHLIGGPITNRLGRKKTSLIFDTLSWSIPMLIWAVAQNFWFFMIAAIINAFVKIVYVSWYCLITEDTPGNKRSKVFMIINLINIASGIFTPITGLFAERFGIIWTMRAIYAIGCVSMTTMFILRNFVVDETRAGVELMQKHRELSAVESITAYIKIISKAAKNKNIILITILFIISNFIVSLNFFQIIYLKEQLLFNEAQISITPGINAVLNLCLFLFIVPKLSKIKEEYTLAASIVVAILGAVSFLLIPGGSLFALFASLAVISIGNFFLMTYRDSVFMNSVGENEKADLFSAVQTLTTLSCIPSGYIAGLLYSINPRLPFILITFLFAISLAVAASILVMHRRKEKLDTGLNVNLSSEI